MRAMPVGWMASLALTIVGSVANAQPVDRMPLRDPTEAPAAARASIRAGAASEVQVAPPRHIVVANGRAYVIEQGRRLSVGEQLGAARIERIDDNSVWLREGGVVRQVPLYPGVRKRPAGSNPAKVDPPLSTRSKRKEKQS